jgi:hypothetical protein
MMHLLGGLDMTCSKIGAESATPALGAPIIDHPKTSLYRKYTRLFLIWAFFFSNMDASRKDAHG